MIIDTMKRCFFQSHGACWSYTVRWLVMLGVFALSVPYAQAAGPAMHVVLGTQWLAAMAPHYTQEERRLFLLGTVFPDIRYLGVVRREQTHARHASLSRVSAASMPFQQGMLFHSFVDEQRWAMVRQSGIGKKLAEIPSALRDTFLKLVEDEILYESHAWGDFLKDLFNIPDEEKILGIPDKALIRWHAGLTLYFTIPPSTIFAQAALLERGLLMLDADTVKRWSELIPRYAQDADMRQHVRVLLDGFAKRMSK